MFCIRQMTFMRLTTFTIFYLCELYSDLLGQTFLHFNYPNIYLKKSNFMLLIYISGLQITRNTCISARRKWQPTPVFLPGESHGGRSLVGYSPWGRKESDMTERLHFPTYTFETQLQNLPTTHAFQAFVILYTSDLFYFECKTFFSSA